MKGVTKNVAASNNNNNNDKEESFIQRTDINLDKRGEK